MKTYYVYILASKRNGTLYIGVTSNLIRRIYEHKQDLVKGFTKEYKVHDLVYFEYTNDVNEALLREKQLKAWKRAGKLGLLKRRILNGRICTMTWLDWIPAFAGMTIGT